MITPRLLHKSKYNITQIKVSHCICLWTNLAPGQNVTSKVEDNDEKHRSKSRGKICSFNFFFSPVLCDCECVIYCSSEMDLVSHVVPLAELSIRIETIVSSIVLLTVFLQYQPTSPCVLGKMKLLFRLSTYLKILIRKRPQWRKNVKIKAKGTQGLPSFTVNSPISSLKLTPK